MAAAAPFRPARPVPRTWSPPRPGPVPVLAAALLLTLAGVSAPAAEPPLIHRVKAAFVFNFLKFVEWPPASRPPPGEPFYICVLGPSPLREALDTLSDRTAQGRPLRLRDLASPAEVEGCHVLLIGPEWGNGPRLEGLLEGLRERPVLTTSDVEGFAARGGMIGMVLMSHRVRLEVDLAAARRAGLRISSRLLGVARTLYGADEAR